MNRIAMASNQMAVASNQIAVAQPNSSGLQPNSSKVFTVGFWDCRLTAWFRQTR